MSAPTSAVTEAHEEGVHVYRIGWWTHSWWPTRPLLVGLVTGNQLSRRADNGKRFVGRRKFVKPILSRLRKMRRPHRPWQAEYGGCRWCRRGWTAEGVRRMAEADRSYLLATGEWSPWVLRRLARSRARTLRRIKTAQ